MPSKPRKARRDGAGKAAEPAAEPIEFQPDPGHLLPAVGVQRGPAASQRFRVQRARDLVNLQVAAYGCELVRAADRTLLRPTGPTARLEVRLPFQHLGEQSFAVKDPIAQPVHVRAAAGSRLVFRVPQSEVVEYSVEGVLAALRRLPLVVVPAAQPRPAPRGVQKRVLVAVLRDGYALSRGTDGLVLTALTERQAAAQAPTPASELEGLLLEAVELGVARQVLARESATDLTGGRFPDLADLLVTPVVSKPIRGRPRAPRSDETAIEAPYRLLLSPSTQGAFTHSDTPVEAPAGRVELWHSRLGVRVQGRDDGPVTVDETNSEQRIVRAVWARELEGAPPPTLPGGGPFRMPVDGDDRTVLVHQTADPSSPTPLIPVDAHKLYVSALGAYLDLSGYWPKDDATGITPQILSWDHIAPMGRDQFVKLVYPGYLFPFGHSAALVKQTTRQVRTQTDPVARLYTEFFLIVTQPVIAYDARDMPFREIRVRPLVSPGILDPSDKSNDSQVKPHGDKLFWPKLPSGDDLEFVLECLDRDGRRTRLRTPLLFVGAPPRTPRKRARRSPATVPAKDVQDAWGDRAIDAQGQSIAYAASHTPGETSMQTQQLVFRGEPAPAPELSSRPGLARADVVIPAVQQVGLPGQATTTAVSYPQPYLDHGFGGGNSGVKQFLEIDDADGVQVDFERGSDRGGGFLAPNLAVRAVTLAHGAVGNVAAYAEDTFDPAAAFGGLLPKLFGIFPLTELLGTDLPVPSFVSSALDQVSALRADLEALQAAATAALERLKADAATAATQGMRDAAATALVGLTATDTELRKAAKAFSDALEVVLSLAAAPDPADVATALAGVTASLRQALLDLQAALHQPALPAAARAAADKPVRTLLPALEAADDLFAGIAAFAGGLSGLAAQAGVDRRATYAWRTPLQNFPDGGAADALFVAELDDRKCWLSLAASAGPAGADVTAEITDFALNLFPKAPLIRLEFDRLAFHAAAGSKADVDVVFRGLQFQGVLGFVNTLKDLVPFDGFSDPPYLDIDTSGLVAGFDLALPAVSVGVFSLENISLHAGIDIPFLGEALTVGFSFCTREKPFRLTVMMIGGGGFVGLALSPKGLVVLEMALEAGACLSINLGVASGSVSIMVGVYLRLEGGEGSLTGYLRIRGEMDVLGLISASITLELSLTYHFPSGKMIGRASVVVEVDVFLVSFSVSVSCERRLAGSNGDPTYAEVLSIDSTRGTAPEWDAYCAAFAAD